MQYIFSSFSTVVRPGQHIGNTSRSLKLSSSDVSNEYSRSLGKIASPMLKSLNIGVNVHCVHEAPPNTPLGWPCCLYGLQQTPPPIWSSMGNSRREAAALGDQGKDGKICSRSPSRYAPFHPVNGDPCCRPCRMECTVSKGINHFEMEWIRDREEKCTAQHQRCLHPTVPTGQFSCTICSCVCDSHIELRS